MFTNFSLIFACNLREISYYVDLMLCINFKYSCMFPLYFMRTDNFAILVENWQCADSHIGS